jgi:hypothetical protein
MTTVYVLNRLNQLHLQTQMPLFRTKDVADILGISLHSAGKYLETLRSGELVTKIARGKWLLGNQPIDPLQVAEFMTAPKESYISLHSALFLHGMIEQIPARFYAVTIDRSKVIETPLGVYSFHHCNPEFFLGFRFLKPHLKVATPEKALVDYYYFSPAKSRQFKKLPELELPRKFSWKAAYAYCLKIPSKRTRSLVHARLDELKRSMATQLTSSSTARLRSARSRSPS